MRKTYQNFTYYGDGFDHSTKLDVQNVNRF